MNANQQYGLMVRQWRGIYAEPMPDDWKQEACLAILRSYVSSRAMSHIRHADPCLRFYADMIVLRNNLNPTFAIDGFGKLVIWPMFQLVDDWVKRSTSAPLGYEASQARGESGV